ELGVAGADAQTVKGTGSVESAGHVADSKGLMAAYWVTGIIGRQPWNGPTGSARETAKRVSAPPRARRQASSAASPSSVTALATRRPPGRSADQQASMTPSPDTPPPMKTASGAARFARAAGASPATIFSRG